MILSTIYREFTYIHTHTHTQMHNNNNILQLQPTCKLFKT